MPRATRIVLVTVIAIGAFVPVSGAQTLEWGAKAGISRSSVNHVADYYDWLLCCHPLFPGAMVDPSAGTGFTGAGFVTVPVAGSLGVQGELLFSRRRHTVDLQPYEPMQLTFTRDYIEAAALARMEIFATGPHRLYVTAGPVFGFRIGEHADSSDPSVRRRGDPATDIYVVQALVYGTPELLRTAQTSLAVAAGWTYRRVLVEVRFTQGLQSFFKDREGLIAGFVAVGADEPTLRRVIPEFGPFLESAKTRDLTVLAGFRF